MLDYVTTKYSTTLQQSELQNGEVKALNLVNAYTHHNMC